MQGLRPAGEGAHGADDEERGAGGVDPLSVDHYNAAHPVAAHYHLPVNPAMLRIEPGRLLRAAHLSIEPLGLRRYAIPGSDEMRYVDMYGEEPCYCEDALISGRPWVCKHILRALIHEGHPLVLATLRQLVLEEARRNGWAQEG
jgi:hypothetical protein